MTSLDFRQSIDQRRYAEKSATKWVLYAANILTTTTTTPFGAARTRQHRLTMKDAFSAWKTTFDPWRKDFMKNIQIPILLQLIPPAKCILQQDVHPLELPQGQQPQLWGHGVVITWIVVSAYLNSSKNCWMSSSKLPKSSWVGKRDYIFKKLAPRLQPFCMLGL